MFAHRPSYAIRPCWPETLDRQYGTSVRWPVYGRSSTGGKQNVQLIGIDCATRPKNIGISLAETDQKMRVCEAHVGLPDPWDKVVNCRRQERPRKNLAPIGCRGDAARVRGMCRGQCGRLGFGYLRLGGRRFCMR